MSNMRKYDAVLFDLDGTLLDTLSDLAASVNYAMRELGFPERSIEEVCRFVGNGIGKLIDRSAPEGTSEEERKHALDLFREHYAVHQADMTAPYKGILPLLDCLKKDGYRIGVVSNKIDSAVAALCRKYFCGKVDVSVGEREGIARKPAPDSVLYALQTLACDHTRAVYVGDSDVDIKTAENAGMECISVTWGFRSKSFLIESGATHIADSPKDFLKFLA